MNRELENIAVIVAMGGSVVKRGRDVWVVKNGKAYPFAGLGGIPPKHIADLMTDNTLGFVDDPYFEA